jgi:hypothetical protein
MESNPLLSTEPLFGRFAILDPPSSIFGLYFGCGLAASAVSWRNSIFLAPLGGVKLNSAFVNFGVKSQLLIDTVNSGDPLTCFEVSTNLRASGLSPSSIQICQSTSDPRNAR